MSGCACLIVGPSGAGKDTLLDSLRERVAPEDGIRFARRMITRPADVGTEAHIEITPRAFERRLGNGQFCLSWDAHGLRYGIPSSARALVQAGNLVVMSVSRTVIRQARSCFPATYVIEITASPEHLRARLTLRSRESSAAIEKRLARSNSVVEAVPEDFVLRNESTIDEGVRALYELLRPLANNS